MVNTVLICKETGVSNWMPKMYAHYDRKSFVKRWLIPLINTNLRLREALNLVFLNQIPLVFRTETSSGSAYNYTS